MYYWIIEGTEDVDLTYLADFSENAASAEIESTELRTKTLANLSHIDWATVVDLRGPIGDGANCLDITNVRGRSILFDFDKQQHTYLVPQHIAPVEADVLDWFVEHMKQLSLYLPTNYALYVYDFRDVHCENITGYEWTKPTKIDAVLAKVEAIVAEKDAEIAEYRRALLAAQADRDVYRRESGDYYNKFYTCNEQLTKTEWHVRELVKERNAAQRKVTDLEMIVDLAADEREDLQNLVSVKSQIIADLTNALYLLQEVGV